MSAAVCFAQTGVSVFNLLGQGLFADGVCHGAKVLEDSWEGPQILTCSLFLVLLATTGARYFCQSMLLKFGFLQPRVGSSRQVIESLLPAGAGLKSNVAL